MFTDRLALSARETARRALNFQRREVGRRVLGTLGLLAGLWGLVLGSSWLAAIGALTILLSHVALRFWWLRLIEKAAVGGAGAALALTGDPLLDAAGAVLLFSTAGALVLTDWPSMVAAVGLAPRPTAGASALGHGQGVVDGRGQARVARPVANGRPENL